MGLVTFCERLFPVINRPNIRKSCTEVGERKKKLWYADIFDDKTKLQRP